ncbi:hypothetical protein GE09DRAFT_1128989 [Coniochaeta sp. 2T2.1]|nr:hypothetical protein GE09DRAFT_1128989 [Coniochaeta sp. 2T2.1]
MFGSVRFGFGFASELGVVFMGSWGYLGFIPRPRRTSGLVYLTMLELWYPLGILHGVRVAWDFVSNFGIVAMNG